MTAAEARDGIRADKALAMTNEDKEPKQGSSFLSNFIGLLIAFPIVVGVKYFLYYGGQNRPTAEQRDDAAITKMIKEIPEPPVTLTASETAMNKYINGVAKQWCDTPNNLSEGTKGIGDSSVKWMGTPEGISWAEENREMFQEYIRETPEAKFENDVLFGLNKVCPQKIRALAKQNLKQLREEGKLGEQAGESETN